MTGWVILGSLVILGVIGLGLSMCAPRDFDIDDYLEQPDNLSENLLAQVTPEEMYAQAAQDYRARTAELYAHMKDEEK